jgi:transposase-like protein
MGYQQKPLEVKYAVVVDIIGGKKISSTAKKYGVSDRHCIYEWLRRADEGIKESLKPHKPGVKAEVQDLHLETIKRLNRELVKKEEQIKELKKSIEEFKPRPKECTRCGCKKIYRNGYHFIKGKKLFDLMSEGEILVEQFICANCGAVVHLEDDKKNSYTSQRNKVRV